MTDGTEEHVRGTEHQDAEHHDDAENAANAVGDEPACGADQPGAGQGEQPRDDHPTEHAQPNRNAADA
jgi:hypothetical protein